MAHFQQLKPGPMPGDFPEIATARLRIVLALPSMAPAMARFFRDNWEGHLDRWSPPAGPGLFDESHWQGRLAVAADEWRAGTAARFVLVPLDDAGVIAGTCNYTQIMRGPFQACYLGYQASRSHQGRGLMTEALTALNAFAFRAMSLHRIMANYVPANERSARLLERLGFTREGLARDYLFIDGAWRDHVLTALANPGFDASRIRGPG